MTRDFQYLPLRHVAVVKNSNVDKLSLPGESPVRLCNYVDVYRNDRITQAVSFMRASATPSEIASLKIRLGDVLITKDSEQWNDIGVPALVATEADDLVCGYHLTMLRPHPSKIMGSYLAYALRVPEVAVQLHLAAKGVTRYGLSQQGIKSAQVPVPLLEEQGLIVRYLDHAELRIAKAIAAKQRMIKLLEEKKQVVAEEIILGRDQTGVELLDSEVPWLGQVPKHWELSPCRAYLRRRKVLVGRGHSGHVLLSLTLRGLIVRDLSQMKGKFPASFESYQRVEPGDFVFCLFDVDETPRTVGLARVGGMITGAYDVFECTDESLREYLYEYFLTIDRGKKLKPLYRGLRKTVPSNAFASMRIPIPPKVERAALVTNLKTSTAAVDAAIGSLTRELVLLKEYRTRLISDVVTGKLDVREEAAKLPEIDRMELATVAVGENGDDEEASDDD
jgi:type I restriction enzyme S subunit